MLKTVEEQIDAPIEVVFKLLTEPEQVRRWMPSIESMETVSTPADGGPVGIRFRQRLRSGDRVSTFEGVITEFQQPERLSVRVGNNLFLMEFDYLLLRGPGDSTEIRYQFDSRVTHWLFRWFGSLLIIMTQRAMRQQMQSLKRVAESDVA